MKKIFFTLLILSTFSIGINSGCVSNAETPEIIVFSANQTHIFPSDETTIYWFVKGAIDVSIIPEIGKVDSIGSKKINITNSTIFTLIASNMNGISSKKCTITVQPDRSNDSILIDNEGFATDPRDSYDIRDIRIKNDSVLIDIGYTGGCTTHFFSLLSEEQFLESYPVQINIVLAHNDKNDNCDAYIMKTLLFDLTKLKEKWQIEYQNESGTIMINLENYDESIIYHF